MKLLFLDTETTGNDLSKDRICQLCYKSEAGIVSEFFKPPLPISVKAMSITHITNEMVADSKDFQGSNIYKDLQKLLTDHVLIAHNALFDIGMIKNEGLETPQFICTLRVARHLDSEGVIPEYKLQYLRYYLDLNVQEAIAHDAQGDVLVLEALFYRLLKKVQEDEKYKDEEEAIKHMIRISKQPSLIRTFAFGKYKGQKLGDVAMRDPGYLEWLLSEKQKEAKAAPDDPMVAEWVFSINHYLGRK